MTNSGRETRFVGTMLPVETRAEGQPRKIVGYAAMFNEPADIGGMFMEQIIPGAFTDTIANDDIRALFNHDDNAILGRNTAGTLSLSQDAKGLRFEITPPDTMCAKDLMMSIERGDISQCSFQFEAVVEEWDQSGNMPMRRLKQCKLYDVSPVTFAAYDDTSVAVRSLDAWRKSNVIIPSKTPIIGFRLRMRHALRERELAR